MTEFNRKEINSKTLGERLREIRERSGFTIEEVAAGIRVSKKYLKQIEADDYEKMPSEVYIKGFLKSYANFLRVEADDVLAIYNKERGIAKNVHKPKGIGKEKKRVNIPTITLSVKMLFGLLFMCLVVFVLWFFYRETNEFAATPRLLISKPLSNSVTKDNFTEVVGVTDVGNEVTINGQPIFVNEKGEFKERVSLKEGINRLVVKAVNKFNKEIERELLLSSEYVKDIPITDFSEDDDAEVVPEILKMTVKVIDVPVWLSVKADGSVVYNGTMLPDTEQAVEAENEITITSGKANKTLVRVGDDENFRSLAQDVEGVVRDVVFRK